MILSWVKARTWGTGRFIVHTQPSSQGNPFLESSPAEECQTRHGKNGVLEGFKRDQSPYYARLGNEVFACEIQSPNLIGSASTDISWHVSVVARKVNGWFESQSFVHIVENMSQDSSVVVRIIEHTLRSLKKENRCINTAFLCQDNAGCYHSSNVIASCVLMKANTGINVTRVDFSDPQGGKGAYDRKVRLSKPMFAGT